MSEFYMIFARKINTIPEFYMIYTRKINKMPEFYMIFARKIFSRIFGEQMPPPLPPVSYAYVHNIWFVIFGQFEATVCLTRFLRPYI